MKTYLVLAIALLLAAGISGSLWHAQSADQIQRINVSELKNLPIGCLGKQLGAKSTIKCKLVTNNGYHPSEEPKSRELHPSKDCKWCPALVKISKVDNVALSKEIEITLVNAPKLEPEKEYIFKGFESGDFAGKPEWVEQGQIVEPLLHYRPLFVITAFENE
jgi:hypothetical protein